MFEINTFDRLYRRTKTGTGLTDSVVRIELKPVGVKTLRVLTHVTVEDKTTAFTKCRLGIRSGGAIHYLDELQTIAAGELVVARSDILLGEGDSFFTDLTGTTTGDDLVLTCIGWQQDIARNPHTKTVRSDKTAANPIPTRTKSFRY